MTVFDLIRKLKKIDDHTKEVFVLGNSGYLTSYFEVEEDDEGVNILED